MTAHLPEDTCAPQGNCEHEPLQIVMTVRDADETPGWVFESLTAEGAVLTEHPCEPHQVADVAADADVVWIFGGAGGEGIDITPQCLERLAKCRVILRTGSGTDNIPVDQATALGIVVANTPEAIAEAVAEHAIGLLMAILRQIPIQDRAVRSGVWDRDRAFPKWHIRGSTLGFVGFGHIAQWVRKKMASFGLKFIAYDPYIDDQVFAEHDVRRGQLDQVLAESDFISIHCPLTDQTRHLIGARQLSLMKPTAVLINTARGAIIDEPALAEALAQGRIAAAGLDVMEREPPAPDNPLIGLENAVITPHIAGYSDQFLDQFWDHSVRTLIAVARGQMPLWVVNKDLKPRYSFK